jgi:RHS repeat-associated protein
VAWLLAAGSAMAEPILEINDDSLTTYQSADKTVMQDTRPLVDQRGVNIDGSLRLGGGPPMSLSGNPFSEAWNASSLMSSIRLDTGTVSITDVDLSLPAPGFSWVIGRSYNVRQFDGTDYYNSQSTQGVNWFQLSQPELVRHNPNPGTNEVGDMVFLVYGADRFIEFTRDDTTDQFRAVNGGAGGIDFNQDYSGTNSEDVYIYTDQRGWEFYFYGFDADTDSWMQGQFWKVVAPAPSGQTYEFEFDTFEEPGYTSSLPRITGTDSAGREYLYYFDQSTERLFKIDVHDSDLVARVEYEYYSTSESHGLEGDLKLVTISTPLTEADDDNGDPDETTWLIRKKHYRYYLDDAYDPDPESGTFNPGNPHHLRYIIDFEGYRRYDWLDELHDDDPLDATDSSLEPYASASFQYEDSDYGNGKHRRITKAWINGDCGCAGASGAHSFEYDDNGSYSDDTGYDLEWRSRTIVRKPDVRYLESAGWIESWVTQYFDEAGQPLSRLLTDGDPGDTGYDEWATAVTRNNDGQLTEISSPANSTGYTHSTGAFTTHATAGLVGTFTRVASGDMKGFLEDTKHSDGTTGDAHLDGTLEYTSESKAIAGTGTYEVVRPFLSASWVYTEETTTEASGTGPDGAYKTSVSYDSFHSGIAALMPNKIITTLPAVSTDHNGPNSSNTTVSYLDEAGRPIWEKTTDGILNYWQYRSTDGQIEKTIGDADLEEDDFGQGCPQPPGELVSSNMPMHRVTCYTYVGGGSGPTPPGDCQCTLTEDAEGNAVQTGTGPVTVSYTARLADGRFVTLGFADWKDETDDEYYGPASYTVTNHAGQTELSGIISVSGGYTDSAPTTFVDETDDDAITAISTTNLGTVAQMTTYLFSETGQRMTESRAYHTIPASETGTGFDATTYGYDAIGRSARVEDTTGTVQRTAYDALGRTTEQWIGTNDNGFEGGDSGTGNMVQTAALEYDGSPTADGGNSYLTKQTLFVQDGTTGQRVTEYINDFRGRGVVTKGPAAPYVVDLYDNLDRSIATGLYSSFTGLGVTTDPTATTASTRIALSEVAYDELGRVFETVRWEIESDGDMDDSLESDTWYDAAGRVIKVAGSQLTKSFYDNLGRLTHDFILAAAENSSGNPETTYADAGDVDDDIVLQERQTVYGSADDDNVFMTVVIDRYHDDNGGSETTGVLDDDDDGDEGAPDPLKLTASDVHGRPMITAYWYDNRDRLTSTAVYGMYDTNDNGEFDTFTRSGLGEPDYETQGVIDGKILLTTHAYNDDGTLLQVTNPDEQITQYEYDAAGRLTKVVNNFKDGTPSADTDQTVSYGYTNGLMTTMTADLPTGEPDQVTTYTYGVSVGDTSGPSEFDAGHLLRRIKYPDLEDGETDPDDRQVLFAYDAQGEVIWTEDQEGNVLETDYDVRGRQTDRKVTTLATGFDGAVRRISTTYDDLGRVHLVTQYDSATGGSEVDEVKYLYDDWGNLDTFTQDRDGDSDIEAYEISYTFAKATGGRNTVRRSGMTLPDDTSVTYVYSSTGDLHDDDVSRVTQVKVGIVEVAQYDYLGLGQVVGTTYLEPTDDVMWELYGSSSGAYPGLDRFNRIAACTWTKDLSTPLDFYDVDVTYDRNSNIDATVDVLWLSSGTGVFDVKYTMDDLNRLTNSQWGDWNGTSLTNEKRETIWTLSHTGNWDQVQLDLDNDDTYDPGTDEFDDERDHKYDANELTDREEDSINLLYDKVGNLVDDDENYIYEYDAFGRLRRVKNQEDPPELVAEYTYNGLGYRLGWHYDTEPDGDVDNDDPWYYFAYDEQWRVVAMYEEDGDDENTEDELAEQFVHHNAGLDGYGGSSYMDTVILRDRGTERRYYCHDWHGDVVVILTPSAEIAERVKYSAYGIPLGMPRADTDADGTVDINDTLNVTAWWGSSEIRGDINLDGTVAIGDYLAVTGNWGASAGWGALSDIGNRKGYAGYEFDPVLEGAYSFYHVRRRVLNSNLGRWLTRDPLGYVDGANLYEYAKSNPTAGADPYGTGPSGGGGPAPGGGGRRQHTGPKKVACGPGNTYCTFTTCAPCQFGSCPTGGGLEVGPGPSPIGRPCAGEHCAGGRGGGQLQSWLGKETQVIDYGVARDVSSQSIPPGGFQPGPPGRPADMCRYGQSRNRRRVVPCEDGGAKVCVRREVCRWSVENRILVWEYNPRVDGPENCTNCFGDATKMPPLPPGAPLPPVIVGKHPCEVYRDTPTQVNCHKCCDAICSAANMSNPATMLPIPGCPIALDVPSVSDLCGYCYANCPPY